MLKRRGRLGHVHKALLDKDFTHEFPLQIKNTKLGNDILEAITERDLSIREVFKRKLFYHAWKSVTQIVHLEKLREFVERSVMNSLAARRIFHPTTGEVPYFVVSSMAVKNIIAKLYLRFLFIAKSINGVRESGGV